jgi:hypothetical protein
VTKLQIQGDLAFHRDKDPETMEKKYEMANALVSAFEGEDRLYIIEQSRFRSLSSFEEQTKKLEMKGTTVYGGE